MKKSNKVESFEVYFCYYKGAVVYIGKGRKGRNEHCNSGTSHVFELNKIYFTEGAEVLDVKIVKLFSRDSEASSFEKESILKYKPKFNTVFTENNTRGELSRESQEVRSAMKRYPLDKAPKYRGFNYKDYEELVEEFVDYFGYKFATDDYFKIYGYHFYKQLGADKLRALSRFIREGSHKLSKNNHKMAFYDCVKELYGVELWDCLATRGI